MTDLELEQRIRAVYRSEVASDELAPALLRRRVLAIPSSQTVDAGWFRWPRALLVLAAIVLMTATVIGALVVGSGFVNRVSLFPPPSSGPTDAPEPTHSPSVTLSTPPNASGVGLVAVYAQRDNSTADIFTLDPQSGQRVALGSVPVDSVQLRSRLGRVQWTPDRRVITVFRLSDAAQIQAQANVQDRSLTMISLRPTGQAGDEVSPDGTQLAGVDGSQATRFVVRVVDLLGTERTHIRLQSGFTAFGGAAWAPDGSSVVISGCKPCSDNNYLLIVPIDGGPTRQLANSASGEHVEVTWSPDGSAIAYSIQCLRACRSGIGTVNVATGAVTQLTTVDGDGQPTWSPDSRRIAFQRTSKAGSGIWLIDADGNNQTKLTTAETRGGDRTPVWSPDGASLLFTRDSTEGIGDLWTISSGGGDPQPFLAHAVADW